MLGIIQPMYSGFLAFDLIFSVSALFFCVTKKLIKKTSRSFPNQLLSSWSKFLPNKVTQRKRNSSVRGDGYRRYTNTCSALISLQCSPPIYIVTSEILLFPILGQKLTVLRCISSVMGHFFFQNLLLALSLATTQFQ